MANTRIIAAALLMTLLSTPAWSVPQLLNFQGRLSDSGLPVSGARDMMFALYSAPSGGTALFSEAHSGANAVSISSGMFNVIIGGLTSGGIPLSVFDGSERYIEVNVAGTILPRQRVTSVGYALHSAVADTATSLAEGSTIANAGSVTATTINVTTITVNSISLADATVSSSVRVDGGVKIGHSIILGPVSGTPGAPNTIVFDNGPGTIKADNPGAGALTLATVGSNPIVLDAPGNVGVGTASPETPLHVSGLVTSGQGSSVTGGLKLYNAANSNATTIQAGNATVSVTYKLPIADGSAGQILSTDGHGQLAWIDAVPFPGPTIISVSPAGGPANGGTPFVVTGTNFRASLTVSIGGNPASGVVLVNSGEVHAVSPAGTPGAQNVVVRNPDGQIATSIGAFNYIAPSACADGTVEQTFTANSMVGCNQPGVTARFTGSLDYTAAASVCGQGWHLCTMQEYQARGNGALPNVVRWLQAPTTGSDSWGQFSGTTQTYCQTVTANSSPYPVAFQFGGVTTSVFNSCFTSGSCTGTKIDNCALQTGSADGAMCCF